MVELHHKHNNQPLDQVKGESNVFVVCAVNRRVTDYKITTINPNTVNEMNVQLIVIIVIIHVQL